MLTTQANYDMKMRLFKVEYPKPSFADQTLLNEVGYDLPSFTSKEKHFKQYFERIKHLITDEVANIQWFKGGTWHDDMLIININNSNGYYKVSHFS